jgi:hypothetical protein
MVSKVANMEKNHPTILNCFIIASFSLLVASCTSSYLSDSVDHLLQPIPKIALVPLRTPLHHPVHWDLAEEFNFFLEQKLSRSNQFQISDSVFLKAHHRIPKNELWHSKNLSSAKLLLPHDFIVLIEITEYQLSTPTLSPTFIEKTTAPFRQLKAHEYQLKVYARVVDLTSPVPKIIMQEIMEWKIPVSNAQMATHETIADWKERGYFGTGFAAITTKVTKELSARIEERVKMAWHRRLPISRYSQALQQNL